MQTDSFCYCVTTYNKNPALRVWMETFLEHRDDRVKNVVICDDSDESNALEVFHEFNTKMPKDCNLHYRGGRRVGIARNKNRGLKFFMQETDARFVVLWDDDVEFVGPGIETQLLKAEYAHITGYLGDIRDADGNMQHIPFGATGNPFFVTFPVAGETDYLCFCAGSQGVMLFCVREVIERVGYFDVDWKGYYGFEHSIWSNRINRGFGICPDWFAILKGCERYFQTQQVPNTYEPDYLKDKDGKLQVNEQGTPLFKNTAQWEKRKTEIYAGIGIKSMDPGV